MLLSRSTFILLPLWAISALALSIPLPTHDMESELAQQKAIVDEQASSSLPTPSSTANVIAASIAPDFEHRHPSRNGDPYGVSDFGIDPAHITDEQLQSLREAGMIRDLDAEERNDWLQPYIHSWPLLKLCLIGATVVAVLRTLVHFKNRQTHG